MFRVPDYQRGYAWEEQQCQDFLEDLLLLSDGQEHFFGLLILPARSDGAGSMVDERGRSYDVCDVVDGQQWGSGRRTRICGGRTTPRSTSRC